MYPPDSVPLLGVIKGAQRRGFTLAEEIERTIDDLVTIREALTKIVDAQCDSLANCTCEDRAPPFVDLAEANPGWSR